MVTWKYLHWTTLTLSMVLALSSWTTTPKEKTIMLEWSMMKFMSTDFKIMAMMDSKSTAFASCVLLITSAIIMYSSYYMNESKKKISFVKLIMAFITSMMMLIFSPNMISMILGWEGLGMSSFMLIMFYENKKALNSSFYTMIMNRMGDIMMMMSMINMMTLSSWSFNSILFSQAQATILMMSVAAFSKSAQIPFSSWLTEAMAAPTPISALVHSSTLVTAGVFLFIRLEATIKYSKMTTIIFLVSMTTLVMASMNSAIEWDLKKIVALSTLSQMSMMFITISMNLFNLAMFHLLVHATFKALIFLCSSTIIGLSNTQDIRKMNKMTKNMFITKMSLNTASLSLAGFPFMSSFYSKEMIMEMNLIKKMNFMFTAIFYMCMTMTLFYSMKILMFTNSMKFNQTMAPSKESSQQKKSKLILLIPAVMYGNMMNWTININFKIPHLTSPEKMIPTILTMITLMLIKEFYKSNTSSKMKNTTINNMISYMWFMKNLSLQIKKTTLTAFYQMFKNSEKINFNTTIKMMKTSTKKMTLMNFKMTHKTPQKINMIIMTTLLITM